VGATGDFSAVLAQKAAGHGLETVKRKILGHRRHRTTAGYAHVADAHLVEAGEKIGSIITQAIVATMSTATSDSNAKRSL